MSQFEFLRNISFGQYLPAASAVHRLDPRAKIIAYFAWIVAVTLSTHLKGLAFGFGLIIVLLLLSKVPLLYALRGILAPLPFILLLALLQIFISLRPQSDNIYFSYGILSVSAFGLHSALTLLLRFICLVLLLTLASATLSTLELVYGLDLLAKPLRRIGIRTNAISITVQLILRFIPLLALNAEKIVKSQASRGGGWDNVQGGLIQRVKQYLPLLIPLFNVNLKQTDTLVHAMLARGYATKAARSGLREYRFSSWDGGFMFVSVMLAWLMLVLR